MTETMPAAVLHDLWLDWCEVTGTHTDRRDQSTLALFRRQARPPRALFEAMLPKVKNGIAPAWPASLRGDATALERLMDRGTARMADRGMDWMTRLRLRRMLFAAVMIAPTDLGGLGLDRRHVRTLTPIELQELRPRIGRADNENSCPACAVWSWLEVLGTNSTWSRGAVMALGRRRDDAHSETHRHQLEDPCPDWLDWPEQANLLPAIDRWGYLDQYESMHPSSLSVLIGTMAMIAEAPVVEFPQTEPAPVPPARHISTEEEIEILRRADELNARVALILREYR